jgi:hypothetical protein
MSKIEIKNIINRMTIHTKDTVKLTHCYVDRAADFGLSGEAETDGSSCAGEIIRTRATINKISFSQCTQLFIPLHTIFFFLDLKKGQTPFILVLLGL